MSNQYKNALQYAAEELSDKLKHHGIVVDGHERMIVWGEHVEGVPFGTPKSECLKRLRAIIQLAEIAEANKKQTRLV